MRLAPLAAALALAPWWPALAKKPGATRGAVEPESVVLEEEVATEDDARPRQPTPKPANEPREISASSARPPVEIVALGGIVARSFEYQDDVFGELRPFTGWASPALRLSFAWHPGAHATTGAASWFGIAADVEQALLSPPGRLDDEEHSAFSRAWTLGVRARLPAGVHDLTVEGGYGAHDFSLGGLSAELPDPSYRFVRGGIGARVGMGELGIALGAGYRGVLSTGELGEAPWFPRAFAGGVDAWLRAEWAVGSTLALLAQADVRRYFLDMRARPADARAGSGASVAGGAIDQYPAAWLGAIWQP